MQTRKHQVDPTSFFHATPPTARTEGTVLPFAVLSDAPVPAPSLARPPFWRRVLAEVVNRCVPLPFLCWFFPSWVVVVFLYHLFCDCGPQRRSFGHWLFRLRVVNDSGTGKCDWWRTALRRLGAACTQVAWCYWTAIPMALVYELVALGCVLLSPTAKRPEDYVTKTRVMTEREYRRQLRR